MGKEKTPEEKLKGYLLEWEKKKSLDWYVRYHIKKMLKGEHEKVCKENIKSYSEFLINNIELWEDVAKQNDLKDFQPIDPEYGDAMPRPPLYSAKDSKTNIKLTMGWRYHVNAIRMTFPKTLGEIKHFLGEDDYSVLKKYHIKGKNFVEDHFNLDNPSSLKQSINKDLKMLRKYSPYFLNKKISQWECDCFEKEVTKSKEKLEKLAKKVVRK